MEWTGEHRAYLVQTYFKNGGYVVDALRKFRSHFKLNRNVSVPSRTAVYRWVAEFETAHTAKKSMNLLKEIFGDRVISLRGKVVWPARSPDLSPCDFFLWGFLKAKVYEHRPTTIPALKQAIADEIKRIPQEVITKVMNSFRSRLERCVRCGGGHLHDVLFKM